MFCSQCGTENSTNAKYCSNCGDKLVTDTVTSSKIPPDKILKQGRFKLWKKKTFGWPEKGTLTLFSDRIEWQGDDDFIVPLQSIIDVSVESGLGVNNLNISDGDGAPYKFQKIDMQLTLLGLADLSLAAMTNKGGDLASWRELIDKLRFNL